MPLPRAHPMGHPPQEVLLGGHGELAAYFYSPSAALALEATRKAA